LLKRHPAHRAGTHELPIKPRPPELSIPLIRLQLLQKLRQLGDVCLWPYANFPDIFGRAASYVDRILCGANPGELPVQTPTRYELAVNLKTAKALGLVVTRELLYRADEVIE
jgi:hypothetical protein